MKLSYMDLLMIIQMMTDEAEITSLEELYTFLEDNEGSHIEIVKRN